MPVRRFRCVDWSSIRRTCVVMFSMLPKRRCAAARASPSVMPRSRKSRSRISR